MYGTTVKTKESQDEFYESERLQQRLRMRSRVRKKSLF